MNTNEPTTGEIVRALRCDGDANNCEGCRFCDLDYASIFCNEQDIYKQAAERLERQERELLQKTQELESAKTRHARKDAESAELYEEAIARAESAERERDAAIADIERIRKEKIPLCPICDFNDMIRCCHDSHCDGYQLFRRRGLPQEGGGL